MVVDCGIDYRLQGSLYVGKYMLFVISDIIWVFRQISEQVLICCCFFGLTFDTKYDDVSPVIAKLCKTFGAGVYVYVRLYLYANFTVHFLGDFFCRNGFYQLHVITKWLQNCLKMI